MRWERFRARRFGPLEDYEVSFDAPMTVLEGRNEAGKTTMMELACGLFFGYMRRKEDRERLIRRGFRDAVIEGDLRLDDGRLITVRRTLKTSGTVTEVIEGETVRELGDQPLELLQPIGRDVYRNIYALTQNELQFPTQGAWAMLQNRLLSGQVADSLHPVSEVVAALQKETLSLWRPDRRGKPLMEELSRERDVLQEAWHAAGRRQEELSALTRERGDAEKRRRECAQRIDALERAAQEGRSWLAFEAAWTEIQDLRAEAGDLSPYAALTADPTAHMRMLRQQTGEFADALAQDDARIAAAREDIAAFTAEDAAVLEREDAIRLIPGTRNVLRSDEDAKTVLAREAAAAREALVHFLSRNFIYGDADALEDADPDAIRAAVARLAGVRSRREARERSDRDPAARRLGLAAAAALGVSLLLGAGMLSGLFRSLPFFLLLGAGAVSGGVLAFLAHRRKKDFARRREEELVHLAEEYAAGEDALRTALAGLASVSIPEEELAAAVERGQHLADDLARAEDALRHADGRIERWRESFRELSRELLPGEDADPDSIMDRLLVMLEDARERRRSREDALRSLPLLEGQRSRRATQYREHAARLAEAEGLLAGLGGADTEEDLSILIRRRDCARKADTLTESLRRETPDFGARVLRLADPDRPYTEAALAAQRQETESLRREAEAIQTRMGSLDERIRSLFGEETPGEVASSLAALDEKMRGIARERDRLALALGVIRAAEKRYRHENQPEIIRNAAGYLDIITQGRYDRLALNEAGDGIIVCCRDTGEWLDPARDRLSRGTLEQLFLSLRLSLMDHLDPEGETLPVFLDETLINWDSARTRGGLTVLEQIARRRQVFLLTCHPWLAAALDAQGAEYGHIRLS